MFFKETVDSELFKLAKEICKHPVMQKFVLVGGTALSLQIGHRKSVDIDMFSVEDFDAREIEQKLQEDFGYFTNVLLKNGLMGTIRNIKTDIIAHQYKWVHPVLEIEGIRMASLADIAAMKLNAIMGNGSRLKDFIDIAFLSSYFSFQQMLDFFEMKYPNNNSMMALKSIYYFDDIDFDVEIMYQHTPLSWDTIKSRIISMVKDPGHVFSEISQVQS